MDKKYLTDEETKKYAALVRKYANIDSELYSKYNVKRGLRNADGTGVLVGLTTVGEVTGYIVVDNEKLPIPGKLSYRGREIRDIIAHQKDMRFSFENIIYLLLFSEIPSDEEFKEFCSLMSEMRELPEGFTEDTILKCPSNNIMNKLARSVLTLYSYDDNPDDTSVENVLRQALSIISRLSVIAAYGYQAKKHYYDDQSLVLHKSVKDYSIAENFLHLIRDNKQFTPLEAQTLDLMLVLHAEHGGGNNSTFTSHVVTSSGTDIYSTIAAAIGSLKGPRHGGANIKVAEMMDDLFKNVKDTSDPVQIEQYLRDVLDKKANDKSGLVYGMGHAIYTVSDPRAVLLKAKAKELAKEKGEKAMEIFKVYSEVEKITPHLINERSAKSICANVDLYSGFVYQMLGIPRELFTPLFAISRVAGWCAHILEEISTGGRIIRPAYKSVSPKKSYEE